MRATRRFVALGAEGRHSQERDHSRRTRRESTNWRRTESVLSRSENDPRLHRATEETAVRARSLGEEEPPSLEKGASRQDTTPTGFDFADLRPSPGPALRRRPFSSFQASSEGFSQEFCSPRDWCTEASPGKRRKRMTLPNG